MMSNLFEVSFRSYEIFELRICDIIVYFYNYYYDSLNSKFMIILPKYKFQFTFTSVFADRQSKHITVYYYYKIQCLQITKNE